METGRDSFLKEIRIKMARYCAYRDRCVQETLSKLQDLGCTEDEARDTLKFLIEENFVSDARYAEAYARGKFNQNKWGKVKIRYGLRQHGISEQEVDIALDFIPDEEYISTLSKLLAKKISSLQDTDSYIIKNKAAQSVIGKGYEAEIVWKILNEHY